MIHGNPQKSKQASGEMEAIYEEAVFLSDMAEVLKESVYQHNPALKSNDKIALPVLAADARILTGRFDNLKLAILKIHEEKQRNEHNADPR